MNIGGFRSHRIDRVSAKKRKRCLPTNQRDQQEHSCHDEEHPREPISKESRSARTSILHLTVCWLQWRSGELSQVRSRNAEARSRQGFLVYNGRSGAIV
jgi:hypothetical protein